MPSRSSELLRWIAPPDSTALDKDTAAYFRNEIHKQEGSRHQSETLNRPDLESIARGCDTTRHCYGQPLPVKAKEASVDVNRSLGFDSAADGSSRVGDEPIGSQQDARDSGSLSVNEMEGPAGAADTYR